MFDLDCQDSISLDLHTDVTGGLGFGACFEGHLSYGQWHNKGEADGETLFGKSCFQKCSLENSGKKRTQNQKLKFHYDNLSDVQIINKLSSRSSPVMALICVLVLDYLSNSILFGAKHIPGCKNGIGDALSRLQLSTSGRGANGSAGMSSTATTAAIMQLIIR